MFIVQLVCFEILFIFIQCLASLVLGAQNAAPVGGMGGESGGGVGEGKGEEG